MRRKLYYLGAPADGYGWGVANTNLVRELSKLCECIVDTSPRDTFDAPVFQPIVDSHLNPSRKVKAPIQIGYCFTEWPLEQDARVKARKYDHIFAGSNWNVERLREAGIKHCSALHQGVDFERFTPQPPSERKGFVVFSGGKYEFRKGQDYVIHVMRAFQQQHNDAVLLAAWHNPWAATMTSMDKSWLIDNANRLDGMEASRTIMLPPIPNADTPKIYGMAHIGIFPNRCEAGTNLVMSEFMACSRPVIATYAHGHRDVLDGPGPFHLLNGSTDPAGWFNVPPSDILAALEYAYNHRDELIQRGEQCRKLIEPFTWSRCAEQIVRVAFPSSPAQ